MTKSNTPIGLTAVIIAKNEAAMIANCIDTLQWCDEVLVVDSASNDDTAKLAEDNGARVVSFSHRSMAKMRNEALKRVKTDWLFYVDADERITPTLAKEVMVQIETGSAVAMKMPRQNVHYGQIMKHGGWQPDSVTRIFKKAAFKEWYGDIHESPKYDGQEAVLNSPLVHLTHRNTVDGLEKTIAWTPIEADLLVNGGVSSVTPRTVLRKGIMEFLRRALFKAGYKDGQAGMMEAIVQGINRMLVYIQVWERQRAKPLTETYEEIEQQIHHLWRNQA